MLSFDLRSILTRARDITAIFASHTSTKLDDALLVVLDAILADGTLFGWFESTVEADESGTLSVMTDAPVALQGALQARGIDWAKLVELLPVILSLIKSLRG